ncbi:MAG: hypothetical protein J6S04_03445 [Clostridia bacterium]|nr:hypothetical protein [Clostridia bacterium]
MRKIITRTVCMAMCATFALSIVGCKKETPSDTIDTNYQWLNENLTDTSQLDSYAGQNKIELEAWSISELLSGKKSSNNVVSKEIERVTGVSIKEDGMVDNKDFTAEVRYNQLSMTGLPHIAYGRGWIDPDALWDLTDLVDKYCPTIKARMPQSVWNATQVTGGQAGKVYGIPYALGNAGLSDIDPLADPQKTIMFEYNNEAYPYILVRDDVLKAAYPEAKTQAEIDALYKSQGYFTEEDLFDVEIESAQQFRTEFLPKIQHVLDTERNADGSHRYTMPNGRKVKAMLVTGGSDTDTWDFLGVTIPKLLGAAGTHYNTGFTYWDKQSKKIELMLTQDFYKDEVYEWAKMINEGTIVSKEGMTDVHSVIQSGYNSGYYAIGYPSNSYPQGMKCQYTSQNGQTETVQYRKVYMKIPTNDHFEFFAAGVPIPHSVMFFKDSVRESDLPQLLRWLDYQCSRLGDKLFAWGPESAGLFNEDENGVRTYKDENLANQMVYSTAMMGDQVQKYNLSNGSLYSAQPVFSFCVYGASIYHPKASYDLSKMEGLTNTYFSSAIVCKDTKPIGIAKKPSIHEWTNSDLAGVETVWSKRAAIEADLKQILIAGSSRAAFDSKYSVLESTLNKSGWTKAYFNGAYTNKFLELNEDYLHLFYN